jgi:hypothetical protein
VTLDLPPNRSFQILTSIDLTTWAPWDTSENGGLPTGTEPATLIGPMPDDQQFFRALIWEN